jgi:hypothetical protein
VSSNLEENRWRLERGEVTRVRNSWHLPWQPSGDHRTSIPWFTTTRASIKTRGIQWRAIDGGETYPGRMTSKWVRWSSSAPEPELNPVPRSLLHRGYPLTSEHESRRRRESRHRDHRRRGRNIRDLIQLLYHENPYSVNLTSDVQGRLSPNFPWQHHHPTIIQLQSFYGDHAQTCAGSCSNLGSKIASSHYQTRFSLQIAWQPIFGCIFLHIFHNNSVASLKQGCSPLIDL